MEKIELTPITGAQNLSTLNDNFSKIQDALNNQVLFRDNPDDLPNQIESDIDFNGKRIYNLPQPQSPSEPVRYQDLGDVTELTEAARGYAESAEVSKQSAADSATQAQTSTANALTFSQNAANAAIVAEAAAQLSTNSANSAEASAIAAEESATRSDRVPQTSATGAAIIPDGTDVQRPSPLPTTGLLVRGLNGVPEWYDRAAAVWKKFGTGSGELFEYQWHNGPRTSISSGFVSTDGQQLSYLTHPTVCQAIWDNKQNNVTEAVWQSDPTKRNCWSRGDGSSWVRVPDLNAAVAGTGKPFYLRGGSDSLNGTSVGDAIRNMLGDTGLNMTAATPTGAFYIRAQGTVAGASITSTTSTSTVALDVSRVTPTADENRVKTAYGVMTVRVFTEVSNVGALDAGQLATQLGVVDAKVQALDANTGFTIVYPNGGSAGSPATVVANSRYVMSNPFPGYQVICEAEILVGGKWIWPGYYSVYIPASGWAVYFVTARLYDDGIVVQTGLNGVAIGGGTSTSGMPDVAPANLVSAPCRVKVWKLKGGV